MTSTPSRLSDADFAHIVRYGILPSIDIVIRDHAGKVLVGRRSNEPARGTLFVPGGVIRKNERIADAFARILAAETGLKSAFAQARLLGVYEHFYNTNRFHDASYGTHYLVLGYLIEVDRQSDVVPDSQHSQFLWIDEAELMAAPDVHENTKAYFRK